MMTEYKTVLKRMGAAAPGWIERLARWVAIDTQSGHIQGLEEQLSLLEERFAGLGGKCERLDPGHIIVVGAGGEEESRVLGPALRVVKRPVAPLKVLLCGHADTVVAAGAHAVPAGKVDTGRLWGPGALDDKGGIAVMLAALEGLEAFPYANRLGWEVVVTPDEEIGSPASRRLLEDAAAGSALGLLFEPALTDGALVGSRSGSGNYTVTVSGRSAHAGREPEKGRNAIVALARLIMDLDTSARSAGQGIRVNAGAVEGGGPVNVVPDFALGRFNIRVDTPEALDAAEKMLDGIVGRIAVDGISMDLRGGFGRPPKLLDRPTLYLLHSLADCGRELGLDIRWQATGGVCDGNTLAAAGLPNVDSLGPMGAGMHTDREYVWTDSVVERARLTALFLMKLASGRIPWPPSEAQKGVP